MPPLPQQPGTKSSGSTFRQRFGYYLFGVAIGCVLAGMLYAQRRAARQQQQAPQPQQVAPPMTPAPATSPAPTQAPTPAPTPAPSPR